MIKPLPTDSLIEEWLASFQEHQNSEFILRYALMFNELDIDWMEDFLPADVSYTSQMVFDTLESEEELMTYWRAKVENMKYGYQRPTVQLGRTLRGDPAAILYQPDWPGDQTYMKNPGGYVIVETQRNPTIPSIVLCVIPPPIEYTVGSGIFPGRIKIVPREFGEG